MFDFLSHKFSGILSWLKGKSSLSQEDIAKALTQIKEALLDADVPLNVVTEFLASVEQQLAGQQLHQRLNPGEQIIKAVYDKMLLFLGGTSSPETITFTLPSTTLIMGLQGSGKTTTTAKIAQWVIKEADKRGKKRRILLASIDFYRPAAIDQLETLAHTVGIDFYRAQATDVITAAQEIATYARTNLYELLFLDTAGRLHIDEQMMKELKEVARITEPKQKILVLDAMTGQESLKVAQGFDSAVGFNGAVLTKMDSDTRAGAAFAFRYVLKKPIYFLGAGEKVNDLETFIPDRIASRILGMGDIMSLLERANETFEKGNSRAHEDSAQRFMSGNFSLEDFAQQISFINNLGPLQKVIKYLPGMATMTPEVIEQGQSEMKRFKAIIDSMTPKERLLPQILDGSRKVRIARGSGTTVPEINQLLQKFEQSKQFAKMFKKTGGFKPKW